MSVSKVVLDASAVLALVNREKGFEAVSAALPDACISSVNASEVVAKLADRGLSDREITQIFTALDLSVISFDEEQGVIAGMLRPKTKSMGLSLGDRACLSLAMKLDLPVMTADTVWAKLSLGITIQIIR